MIYPDEHDDLDVDDDLDEDWGCLGCLVWILLVLAALSGIKFFLSYLV